MLTIIFTFSLFFLAAIVGLKFIEEKKRRKLLFPRSRERADIAAAKIVEDVKIFFAVLNGRNVKLFAMFMGRALLSAALSVKRKSSVKKLEFLNSLRHSGNFKKQGPASFFLKNVSEYKPALTPEAESRSGFVNKDISIPPAPAMKRSSPPISKYDPSRHRRDGSLMKAEGR